METAAVQRRTLRLLFVTQIISGIVYFFVVDPILSGLKTDARGVALLERMNLKQ